MSSRRIAEKPRLKLARQEEPDLILLDIRLPDINGLQVLEQLRQEKVESAVIIMTADTTSSNAIQATQLGAFDYIAKPINDEHLLVLIRRALEYRNLERELRNLRNTPQPQSLSTFVGTQRSDAGGIQTHRPRCSV